MNIDNTPSTIIKQLGTTGEPIGSSWSYYDLSKHIQNNDIDGVSIVTNNDHVNGLFAIDNAHDVGNVIAANVHPIQIIPELTDTIIQKLDTGHIPFDILDVTRHGLFDTIPWPLQLVGYYFIGSIL